MMTFTYYMRCFTLTALFVLLYACDNSVDSVNKHKNESKLRDSIEVNDAQTMNDEADISCPLNGSTLSNNILLNARLECTIDSVEDKSLNVREIEELMPCITGFNYSKHTVAINKTMKDSLSYPYAQIFTSNFIDSDHDISLNGDLYCEIDGHGLWGAMNARPKTQIDSIIITNTSGKRIMLPEESVYDLYEPNLPQSNYHYIHFYKTDFGYLLWMQNSDGGGAYYSMMVTSFDKYLGRIIGRPF